MKPGETEQRTGSMIGTILVVPAWSALIMLIGWVLVSVLLTPGVQLEGAYGEMQRELRMLLIVWGIVVNSVLLGILVRRIAGLHRAG